MSIPTLQTTQGGENKAMKTLYIAFYDYPYIGQAYMRKDNGKLRKLALSEETIDRIYNSTSKWGPTIKPDISDILARYDQVIVCEDGEFTILK